jgi:transcriptional regulator with XRE-family HTH domain
MAIGKYHPLSAEEIGIRIFHARLEASAQRREQLSQHAVGALVAELLRRRRPITAATVSRWESGDALPSLPTVDAIARACGVDPGWLAFGERSRAPSPRSNTESFT